MLVADALRVVKRNKRKKKKGKIAFYHPNKKNIKPEGGFIIFLIGGYRNFILGDGRRLVAITCTWETGVKSGFIAIESPVYFFGDP